MSNEDGGALYRQSDALRDILTWSEDRDLWQRDALRQLFQGTAVDGIDLDLFSHHAIHLNQWSEIPRPPLGHVGKRQFCPENVSSTAFRFSSCIEWQVWRAAAQRSVVSFDVWAGHVVHGRHLARLCKLRFLPTAAGQIGACCRCGE